MSDAPNNERRWVCVHSETSQPCAEVTAHVGCGYPDAAPVPSPVPSRPDTPQPPDPPHNEWASRESDTEGAYEQGWDLGWSAGYLAADAQPAADQGPDLSELAETLAKFDALPGLDLDANEDAEMEWHLDYDAAQSRVVGAVRRLLDREGGTQ